MFTIQAQNLTATEGYIRESIPGTTVSSAYMTLTNTSEKSVTLVGASSKISARIEIHEHSMSNGMMSMRQVESIVIGSKETAILQPSGLHLMIFDIKEPLKHGDLITLTLHFSSQPNVEIQLPVQSIKRKQHHH
ncbi:MAG: copper chaperone PCu(A)C [Colwellia sp.]|nr:copper chaperone PCu(A)C [Colwellia sp.]